MKGERAKSEVISPNEGSAHMRMRSEIRSRQTGGRPVHDGIAHAELLLNAQVSQMIYWLGHFSKSLS